ncbi:hypothetical protein Agabi119p4_2535 [Agaricus bisporus var. burnettii]|uniref:Uncharacterized protein n=1 Tax=Agaricus bisporus var. burnettii TaxID=192524 RepID=A0A8H7F9N1_AGABI|nr:hypothetical protein Agabi119p4_2535 [Agaricus bisporus var. burnettii]
MARGRPPKKRSRNTSGLRNQHHRSLSTCRSDDSIPDNQRKSPTPANVRNAKLMDDEVLWDMMRSREDEEEEVLDREFGYDSEVEVVSRQDDEFGDEDFEKKMAELALQDDPTDTDWLPCSKKPKVKLTGKAALWAVRQQKSHRQVSNRAMMSIDALLT